jgi:hypothetical protein
MVCPDDQAEEGDRLTGVRDRSISKDRLATVDRQNF